MKPLQALKRIESIELSHLDYNQDENLNGDWEYSTTEVYDGTVKENFPIEIKTIENVLVLFESIQKALNNGEVIVQRDGIIYSARIPDINGAKTVKIQKQIPDEILKPYRKDPRH